MKKLHLVFPKIQQWSNVVTIYRYLWLSLDCRPDLMPLLQLVAQLAEYQPQQISI